MDKRPNQYRWIFLKSLGISIAVMFGINLAILLFGLLFYGVNEEWDFNFRHLVFTMNNREMGLRFFEAEANGLMLVLFMAVFAKESNKPLTINF